MCTLATIANGNTVNISKINVNVANASQLTEAGERLGSFSFMTAAKSGTQLRAPHDTIGVI